MTESTELPLSGTGGELPLRAAAASALTCTRKGSDPPTRREMAALGFA